MPQHQVTTRQRRNVVLLDLDGTLTQSDPGIIACATKAFEELGLPVPDDQEMHRFIGPAIIESFRRNHMPDELLDRYPTHISGGEQQRVAIARGLTMDRRLLLADEPTGNLDSENSDNIIDLLLRLAHEENRCVIVVTHDLTVMDRADVVYRISDGLLQRRQNKK